MSVSTALFSIVIIVSYSHLFFMSLFLALLSLLLDLFLSVFVYLFLSLIFNVQFASLFHFHTRSYLILSAFFHSCDTFRHLSFSHSLISCLYSSLLFTFWNTLNLWKSFLFLLIEDISFTSLSWKIFLCLFLSDPFSLFLLPRPRWYFSILLFYHCAFGFPYFRAHRHWLFSFLLHPSIPSSSIHLTPSLFC